MTQTIQDRIHQRLDELGLKASRASVLAGGNRDLIRKIFERPNSNPRSDTLRGLAAALQTSEQWLLTGEDESIGAGGQHVGAPALTEPPERMVKHMERDNNLPILGTAAGSLTGAFHFVETIAGYVERPPALRSVPDAYAVYVTGSSMEPEHRHGDLRFIDPSRPPRAGETVIVQVQHHRDAPIEGFIGHLVRYGGDRTVIRKLNPVDEIVFDRQVVRKLHRVMTVNDMYGR